jgi:hypothetical protein
MFVAIRTNNDNRVVALESPDGYQQQLQGASGQEDRLSASCQDAVVIEYHAAAPDDGGAPQTACLQGQKQE